MRILKHYLAIYGQFVSNAMALELGFRLNFFLLFMVDIFFFVSMFFSTAFIFDSIPSIGGWNRDQFLFFTCFMLTVDSLYMAFISSGFWEFSRQVSTGNLDFVLIKPANSIFISFFRNFSPSSFGGLIVATTVLIYFAFKIELSPINWVLLPLFLFLGTALLSIMELIIATSVFYTVEGTGINFLRIQFHHLYRWPDFLYLSYYRRIFVTVVPILLVSSAPVRFLLDSKDYHLLWAMILAIGLGIIILKVLWKRGLRYYNSASS